MKRAFLLLSMLSLAALARADDQTQAVQQALKDQGFYYGTIDGQGGPETDAAIKRYQIRQGLEVTGTLDAETLSSLNLGGGAKSSDTPQAVPPPPTDDSAQPAATPVPPVVQSDHEFLQNQNSAATPVPGEDVAPPRAIPVNPDAPGQPQPPEPQEPPQPPGPPPPQINEGQTVPRDYAFFLRKTPYASAPVAVQRDTVGRAQVRLAREGFYRGIVDGQLSDRFSHAISAYQDQEGLRKTGRLDIDTLADMHILPGPHTVVRVFPAPFPPQNGDVYPVPFPPPNGDAGPPVYRGIWVH